MINRFEACVWRIYLKEPNYFLYSLYRLHHHLKMCYSMIWDSLPFQMIMIWTYFIRFIYRLHIYLLWNFVFKADHSFYLMIFLIYPGYFWILHWFHWLSCFFHIKCFRHLFLSLFFSLCSKFRIYLSKLFPSTFKVYLATSFSIRIQI